MAAKPQTLTETDATKRETKNGSRDCDPLGSGRLISQAELRRSLDN
jgi:hypothetical protein